ncbi:MAG: adenylate/guanylate cyclase domain-containing protein [Saprospiraceae bacterium]
MKIIHLAIGIILLSHSLVNAQFTNEDIKIYDVQNGLSHRNVFKIQQDAYGFIWIATINGLNRFDGTNFIQFSSQSQDFFIPFNTISDMIIGQEDKIWLANPDYLTTLHPEAQFLSQKKIKEGPIVRRESMVPHNLLRDTQGRIWMATYDEKSGNTMIQTLSSDSTLKKVLDVPGQYIKRPILEFNSRYFIAAFENELWEIDEHGKILQKWATPVVGNLSNHRIVQMQALNDKIWVLLANGKVYERTETQQTWTDHPLNNQLPSLESTACFLVEDNGDIWIGARGSIWYYSAYTKQLTNYDEAIRPLIKNTCLYRQIFKDQAGVIWLSTDFGAIRIDRSENFVRSSSFFTQILSGGNENCSNVFCSIRGITEDENGKIYFSYYNSIHTYDPKTEQLQPLFPSNDFFNFPFGIHYHKNALYTGNGRKINLKTLAVDTIFNHPSIDMGDVIEDQKGRLWFGYQSWLYQYDAEKDSLIPFEDQYGQWDTLAGQIGHLYQKKGSDNIWVSTLDNGVYKIDPVLGRTDHFHAAENSPIRLRHQQVNAAFEDNRGFLWLATAYGLHRIHLQSKELEVFTTEDGLPNNFINGILPENDTVLWLSTDAGLSRFSIARYNCLNFSANDGLSSNEFNRISFFKASDERMYFGGLNGINAFYPSRAFMDQGMQEKDSPIRLAGLTRLDGKSDSLIRLTFGLQDLKTFVFSPWDRFFSFKFAKPDFRHYSQTSYSYWLEGFEEDWSPPTAVSEVRYNNIPAGKYTLRVKAKTPKGGWSTNELALSIHVKEAYYKTWWFWSICAALLFGGLYLIARYRIYAIKKREKELEELVKIRTQELEKEKQKSEELLLNILPAGTADELKKFGSAKARRHEMVTVMFSDFKGFSRISELLEPEELVAKIDHCFRAFDRIIGKHGLEKIKTVGDAYLCVGGIASDNDKNDATNVINAALEIQEFMNENAKQKELLGQTFFEARIGIHTGPLVAGIVGIKKFAYDIWGDTVNIASRMETNGETGQVNISAATYALVKEQFRCVYHGEFKENKNAIGMYFVEEVRTNTTET